MEDQTCEFSRCRNYCYLIYAGKPICEKHWKKICEAEGKTEKRVLKKIGLVRDGDGKVVPL